jgi:hypothetical protein
LLRVKRSAAAGKPRGKTGLQPIVSLDGFYDFRADRKAIFNRAMKPNINSNPLAAKPRSVVASRCSIRPFSMSASAP